MRFGFDPMMRPEAPKVRSRQDGSSTIGLLVQTLPPSHDAIGEYTRELAIELARSVPVRVFSNAETAFDPLPGVHVIPAFGIERRQRFTLLQKYLLSPDLAALVVQYNPFCWGRRGWAPEFVRLLERVKKNHPELKLAVMFHETYMMNPGLRSWVMRLYQRHQFERLVECADISFFSTKTWSDEHRPFFPGKRLVDLPVGSNLPKSSLQYQAARALHACQKDEFVCGVFGGSHVSRLFPWIETAVQAIARELSEDATVKMLYIGDSDRQWQCGSVPVVRLGRLDAPDAANVMKGFDLLVNPLTDGLSTRRGSVMAAIQHGVPVVSTHGHCTEPIWYRPPVAGIYLGPVTDQASWDRVAADAARAVLQGRAEIGDSVEAFYRMNFDWPVIVQRLLQELSQV
jgi:glycosyltransferase involved in cell wall biosynthesis